MPSLDDEVKQLIIDSLPARRHEPPRTSTPMRRSLLTDLDWTRSMRWSSASQIQKTVQHPARRSTLKHRASIFRRCARSLR